LKYRTNKSKKVLIELPTWLGDSVMATPAIENIIKHYKDIDITLMGSIISTEALKNNPYVSRIIVLDKKLKSLFRISSRLEKFDIFFTFRSSYKAMFLKLLIKSDKKYQFINKDYSNRHQVEKYVDFVNHSLNKKFPAGDLKIYPQNNSENLPHKILGINPGASYGSAKRWYPEQFAEIAIKLSSQFDIWIFGSNQEKDFATEIEKILVSKNINNYLNLAGQTSITKLIDLISNLDILITGDSGPMHIGASLKIPTIAIFGPTNYKETSQWMNPQSVIVKKNLNCQPCMKRTCPLNHHNCMKLIKAKEVIESIPLLQKNNAAS
jgi:heptosyltransferase II